MFEKSLNPLKSFLGQRNKESVDVKRILKRPKRFSRRGKDEIINGRSKHRFATRLRVKT